MSVDEQSQMPKMELLGEILIKRKLINDAQLKKALDDQKNDHRHLGEILVGLGFLEEKDIVVALILQCNFPYIAVQNYEIDHTVIALFTKEFAWKNLVIPLDRVGEILSVVMVDPLNLAVKAEIQRMTNFKIAPFIATKSDIEKALNRWYE